MKRLAILGSAAILGLIPNIASARSHARFFFGFGFGVPAVVVAPPPVICEPAPVVVEAPAPVVCQAAPVVVAPPEVVYSESVCPPVIVVAPRFDRYPVYVHLYAAPRRFYIRR